MRVSRKTVSRDVIAKATKAWKLKFDGRTQPDIASELRLSTRSVQYYLSMKWLEERGLEYLADRDWHEPRANGLTEEKILEVLRTIRPCFHDPRLDEEAYLAATVYPLLLDGHNWALVPQLWVKAATPDFDNPSHWGSGFPVWKQHTVFKPLFTHLSELEEMAIRFYDDVGNKAEFLCLQDQGFLLRWRDFQGNMGWVTEESRIPTDPEPDWSAVNMPYEDAFANEVCDLLSKGLMGVIYPRIAGLVRKLEEINEDLESIPQRAGELLAGVSERG